MAFETNQSRRFAMAGTFSETEREAVAEAFKQGGFRNVSQAIRVLGLAYLEDAGVRDRASKWLRANVDRA
jgi:hypothetical protein